MSHIFLAAIPLALAGLCANPLYAAASAAAGAPSAAVTQTARFRVMTFNIRWEGFDGVARVRSGFTQRKPLILAVLTRYAADIIGLQEASTEQRTLLAPGLPAYGMYPLPQAAGDECILYRLDRFDLLDSGHEILRGEPEQPGTNIGVRDFVWVRLQDRASGKRLYVLNLHADNRSAERGRELDGVLLGEWIRNRRFADPVTLVGDINGKPDQPRMLYLTGQRAYRDGSGQMVSMPVPLLDTFTAANPDAVYTGTFNAGYSGRKNRSQVDYILVPKGTKVIDSRIIYYHENGSYPSDHFPLLSEFELE